jgi:hypothetical protein
MEQILINLVTGALGGIAAGKSSPTFDLGMIGNIISGLIGGGVARPGRYFIDSSDHGRSAVGRSEHQWRHLARDRRRRWRGHTHGNHWRDQKQSCCLTAAG